MSLSETCIRRPVLTTLITASLIVFGIFGYRLLSVAALPRVDYPTLSITGAAAGRECRNHGASVASPIERQLSTISGITSMTSVLAGPDPDHHPVRPLPRYRRRLSRRADGAAIAARRLPPEMTTPPFFRKLNPGDFPILFVSVRSDTLPLSTVNEYAETVIAQQISQLPGVAQVQVYGAQKFAVRVQVDPVAAAARNISFDDIRTAVSRANSNTAGRHHIRSAADHDAERLRRSSKRPPTTEGSRWPGATARRSSTCDSRARHRQRRERQDRELVQRYTLDHAGHPAAARRQHGRGGRRCEGASCRPCARRCPRRSTWRC
jgi:hypothetical protein